MKPNNTALKSQFLDNFQDDRMNDEKNLFKTLLNEKGKWNFIIEFRNEKRTITVIRRLRSQLVNFSHSV